MALIKRKSEELVDKSRQTKKQKPSSTSKSSILRDEEPAFPRGGASVLTPLEHKQIKIQAKQDVLFEQQTGKKPARHEFEDEENDEDILEESNLAAPNTKPKPQRKAKIQTEDGLDGERRVRAEGLGYKRLVPGSIILGQVSQINRYDVALSLPNNLTGYLPLTAISDKLSKRLEALGADDDENDDPSNETQIDLKKFLFIGQYLRTYVTSTQQAEKNGAPGKKHIELSINPRENNAGLTDSDCIVNNMIQASVASVEDHGLIMDLGIEVAGIKGFMSSKELGPTVDISQIEEGSVFLCIVIGRSSNGNIVKLSADPQKIGNIKKGSYLTDAPSVDSFLPGTAVDVLVSEVTPSGIIGKVMGLLNVTADLIHSGAAASEKDLEKKYSIGSKIKARIICTFPTVDDKKLGISLQDHILYWRSKTITPASTTSVSKAVIPTEILPLSTVLEQARVVKVEHGVGLLLDVGVKGVKGFVHISMVSDGKIETLSESTGAYKVGSVHKARIVSYNSLDGLFIVSMQPRVIEQPFFRIEDVKVGQIIKGTVEKMLVGSDGVIGVIMNLAEGITGLVPEVHLADVHLQHPEKKFKEGNAVTARVLSTDIDRRRIRLTLKKTLVNSDVDPWISYQNLKPGLQAPGTLVKILPSGAVVQFYGSVRAFLPVSEMSESYISDPNLHFRTGQVVNVHIVSIDPAEQRMIVSCKDPSLFGAAQQEAFNSLRPGLKVVGTVTEKLNEEIVLELESSGLKAILPIEHLSDGSSQKARSLSNRIRVGQKMTDLLVLHTLATKRMIKLTSKPSLLKASTEGGLLRAFEDVHEGSEVQGFVNNITPTSVFVQFAGDLTALLLKQHLPEELSSLPDFGMRRHQSVAARVLSIDFEQKRFLLTQKPVQIKEKKEGQEADALEHSDRRLSNAIDGISTSIDDFTLGKMTKARIVSIKETQMNVQLADAVQGRIDVSEIFDSWEEIKDRKYPLKKFHTKEILPVRILGMHDSRNHRFLPITHRSKAPVFELTAKPSNHTSADLDILTLDKVEVGTSWLTFVNNVTEDCVWVNLSPNVRGRIRAMDVVDDISQLKDLAKNFPVGSVLRAKVLRFDLENNRLDLSARLGGSSNPETLQELSKGMILPARVTKATERHVMVQLSDALSAPVNLVDLADDYNKANPTTYQKNQIVRVCVKDIDIPNKRITLSARPSKVLSSSLPVKDPEITSIAQLKVNDIVRGFIKNIADSGVFVSIGSHITSFIRVSDLSDEFLKDWKAGFEIDHLVEGKIIAIDANVNRVQMSLRRSHIDKNYEAPLTFADMKVGQIVTGKVRKVEDFGVFVVVDNSANVSGLCHRTKMSDQASANPRNLFEENDVVKAKVLSINKEKKQISFGLKASYFESQPRLKGPNGTWKGRIEDEADGSDALMEDTGGITIVESGNLENESASRGDLDLENIADIDDVELGKINESGVHMEHQDTHGTMNLDGGGIGGGGLGAGFDWTGEMADVDDQDMQSDTDVESVPPRRKKRRRAEIAVDRTGYLDADGPQSIADFERLLMGQPNSSVLWLSYMAFQLQLSEVGTAREIAERALKTINIREETEKLNVWVALLNLENTYGTTATLEEVFKRACQYNDSQEIHERLISIYIQSDKHADADELFQTTLKKHSQSPDLYINYATFLMTTLNDANRARNLLPRAMQTLPSHTHLALTSKFAQLEFNSPNGEPERGRTIFETLLSQWPKRLDLWNVLLDLEMKQGNREVVRRLFERVTGGSSLKPRKAKFFFKKWLSYEEKAGDGKTQERVKALAAQYVKSQERSGNDE